MKEEFVGGDNSIAKLFNGSRLDATMNVKRYYIECVDCLKAGDPTFMLADPNNENLKAYYFNKGVNKAILCYSKDKKCEVFVGEELVANGEQGLSLKEAIELIEELTVD